jgi:hypothetical protein
MEEKTQKELEIEHAKKILQEEKNAILKEFHSELEMLLKKYPTVEINSVVQIQIK